MKRIYKWIKVKCVR